MFIDENCDEKISLVISYDIMKNKNILSALLTCQIFDKNFFSDFKT